MKLLYNIAGTYRPAGMERVLANKANWLAAHGHEVIIVTILHLIRLSSALILGLGMRTTTEDRCSTR